MKFSKTAIEGVFVVEATPFQDERGSFARVFCPTEFAAAGIEFTPCQMNLSRNPIVGTLRGLHFQRAPNAEDKLVRCTAGRIFDVAVDLRTNSASYGQWFGLELDAAAMRALLIPKGCAHGFLSLEPHSDVLYATSHPFTASHDAGVRWNDPRFAIRWPKEPMLISTKDAGWPDVM